MKQKTIGILSLMTVMFFAFTTATLAGNFKIQSPVGTDIFTVDTSGNVNASGTIRESNALLSATYWAIADVATPNDGDTTHLSTADQIFDYIASLSYVANAWDTLDDMVLTDTYIFVGNGTNDPQGVAMSSDATIDNTGAVTVTAAIARDAEVLTWVGTTWGFWNESNDLAANELAEAKINFDTVCAAGNHLYVNGDNLACEADDDTTYTNSTPITLAATTFGLMSCPDNEILKYDVDHWACEADGGAGLNNVIEDLTPQLGGNLDVNDFGIDGGGSTNMTIDASGNFIIVLS